MKWLRREGQRYLEECIELSIDIENRTLNLECYFNDPLGGGGNSYIFAFEEATGEKFLGLIATYGDENFDRTFGAGASAELSRILMMSKTQYEAEDLQNKEILIDKVVGQFR